MTEFNAIVKDIQDEFPNFKLIPKQQSKLMLAFFYLSLAFLWCPKFMTGFTSVLGTRCYMPERQIGTDVGYLILRHERVHMRDYAKWGPLFFLSYIFLPIGPSFRAYWEFKAYKESMLVAYETVGVIPDWLLEHYAAQFTGSTYLWMFPFPKTIRKLLEKARQDILSKVA